MNRSNRHRYLSRLLVVLLSCGLSFSTFQAASEDIDIFSVDVDETVNKPNVLIILDNSANWSRQAQQWPGGLQQGQSEVRAIRDVILGIPGNPQFPGLPDNSVNVGILEHITGGNAGENDSGYIRQHIVPMSAANKPILADKMNTIFADINGPSEKRSQGNPFGNLMWDAYNYLAGDNASQGGAGTLDSLSDDSAYDSKHDNFRSPLTSTDTCTRTVIIFIGNNTQGGPTGDSGVNVNALSTLGGDTSQIPFANYDVITQADTAPAGYFSSACYSNDAAGASACTTAEANTTACTDAGFTDCFCNATSTQSCASLAKFEIHGQPTSESVVSGPSTTTTNDASTGEIILCQNNNPGGYTCPASGTTSQNDTPAAGQRTETTISWANCHYQQVQNACGNNNNKDEWRPVGDKTETVTVFGQTLGPFEPVGTAVSTCRTDTASCTSLDFPAACSDGTYANCRCEPGTGDTAACGSPPPGSVQYSVWGNLTATVEAVADGTFRPAPTQGGSNFMADEWARFLREVGVELPGAGGAKTQVSTYTIDVFNAQQHVDFSALLFNMARVGGGKYFQAKNENQIRDALQQIFDEIQAVNSAFSSASLPVNATNRAQNENQVFIGVFRPDRTKGPQWFGNLKRFQIIQSGPVLTLGDKNGNEAINDATGFLADCAVSFWTTPSGDYWLEVITDDPPAVGNCSGVPGSENSDSPDGPFVEKGAVAEVLRRGNDPSATVNGEGNFDLNRNLQTRSGSSLVDFTLASLPDIDRDGDSDVDADDAAIKDRIFRFIRGEDVFDDDLDNASAPTSGLTEPRSIIHGDVIHSRPQPINYGDTDGNDGNGVFPGVVMFYGANDGTFRSVNAATGQELWSFVAPEHYGKFGRLTNDSPNIRYFGDTLGQPKDYFFDGSTGVFQNADNSKVFIYPTMRRGGRKIYAFDVTDDPSDANDGPANPSYLWSKGCDASGVCDNDANGNFSAMGQTWSLPAPGFIAGYSSGTSPVVVFGGGYDACEDANTSTPACGAALGRGVYVVDAETGVLIRHFDFSGVAGARSVAADVVLIDVNSDLKADFAYAVDTGGSVYRMNFLKSDGTPETNPANWTFSRIARTSAVGRKFLFPPALFQATSKVVYVVLGAGDREAPLINQYPYDDSNGDGTSDGGVLNRFYVFKDDLTGGTSEINLDTVSSSNMLDYTNESTPCCNDPVLPGDPGVPGTPDPDYAAAPKGWFINLNENGQGEQTVTSAVIVAGLVFFSTNRPTLPSGTACENSLGEARGYILNLFNGSGAIGVEGSEGGDRSSVFVGGGLPPSPVTAVVPINGILTTILIGGAQQDGSISSYLDTQEPPIPIKTRRTPLFWFKSNTD